MLFGAAAVTLMLFLWFIDPLTNQRAFGAVIASEFLIFAMMIQVYRKPSITGSSNSWLLLGCSAAALFLLLAVQLATA